MSRAGVILLAHKRFVVSAGCTGAGMLSQAKIYQLECLVGVDLYSKRSHCTFASQYLASQWLELIDATV